MFNSFALGSRLGDDGAKYIADVLKVNTTLKIIHIGCKAFFLFFFFFSFCFAERFHY